MSKKKRTAAMSVAGFGGVRCALFAWRSFSAAAVLPILCRAAGDARRGRPSAAAALLAMPRLLAPRARAHFRRAAACRSILLPAISPTPPAVPAYAGVLSTCCWHAPCTLRHLFKLLSIAVGGRFSALIIAVYVSCAASRRARAHARPAVFLYLAFSTTCRHAPGKQWRQEMTFLLAFLMRFLLHLPKKASVSLEHIVPSSTAT